MNRMGGDVLLESEDFISEHYEKFTEKRLKGAIFEIFDENGKMLYTSRKELGEFVPFREVSFLVDGSSPSYYDVKILPDTGRTLIFYEKLQEDTGYWVTDSYCELDENYIITDGTLFQEYGQLDSRIVRILGGESDNQNLVQRFDFCNADGAPRIMVYMAPAFSEEEYRREMFRENVVMLGGFGMAGLGLLLVAYSMVRKMRRSLMPLNEAINGYRERGYFQEEDIAVPRELSYIMDSFNALTIKLEKTEAARQKEEQDKSRMIMSLSHDLKTPLAVIKGYAQALENHKVPEEDIEKYLEVMLKKADISVTMINDLVKYASLEHPDYKAQRVPVNVCELCRSFLADNYQEFENADMELEVEIPDGEIIYPLDIKLFSRVLQNLTNNAIRYNPPGTRVFFHLQEKENYLEIGIADNGIGVPEEIREDFFRPFVTGNEARTSEKGTGIGMAIVKSTVRLHGGEIFLEDPSGTKFSTIITIRLPLQGH